MEETEDLRKLRDEMAKDVAASQRDLLNTLPHITPTVGRVVWYWSSDEDNYMSGFGGSQPFRADVCHVLEDGRVNLSINDANGGFWTKVGVTLYQGDAQGCSLPRPFATWMPYQKGQAAKTEAAEQRAVGSFQTEHERLSLAMLAEQVRELRLQNARAEAAFAQQQADNERRMVETEKARAKWEAEEAAAKGAASQQLPEVPGMPPHQVRMRFERDELSIRLSKLNGFIGTAPFIALDETEQELMHEQAEVMQRYLACLQDRIALFNERQDQA